VPTVLVTPAPIGLLSRMELHVQSAARKITRWVEGLSVTDPEAGTAIGVNAIRTDLNKLVQGGVEPARPPCAWAIAVVVGRVEEMASAVVDGLVDDGVGAVGG
jgi:hypothetical protein